MLQTVKQHNPARPFHVWRAEHAAYPSMPTSAERATDQIAQLATSTADPAKDETQRLPAITTGNTNPLLRLLVPRQMPRFIGYELATNNPLQMLYGACFTVVEQFNQLPSALLVSPVRLASLDAHIRAMKTEPDGYFHFLYGRDWIADIPILIEPPKLLKLAIRQIHFDQVFAILAD